MKVLVICDDLWHPAEVIELGLAGLPAEYECTVVKTAKDILTPAYLAEFPLVVCCKGNTINAANPAPWFEDGVTEVTPREFEAYVQNGGGFLSLHAGNTAKQGQPYADFVGNYFAGHPPRCSVDVHITQKEHPVARGVSDFTARDEHYNIVLSCTDAQVFCRTVSETGGEQIGGYTREIGKGRLCMLTPGHTLSVWQNREFLKLLDNAMRWCASVR